MTLKRQHIISVLNDAILDRQDYLEAVAGIKEYELAGQAELEDTRKMLQEVNASQRYRLTSESSKILRQAAIRAVLWRESFLNAVRHTPSDAVAAKNELSIAQKMRDSLGGDPMKAIIEKSQTVTLSELRSKKHGYFIESKQENGQEIWTVHLNGELLGTVSPDQQGILTIRLADGELVDQEFESHWEACTWLQEHGKPNENNDESPRP